MPDDPKSNTPLPDDGPPPDPVEAELIAYLDGELDPAAARKVEAKLAADAELRKRAAALKKTFDLLDFLPQPEPSPTFATRTLDKLPAAKSSIEAKPVPAPSLSVPVVLQTSPVPTQLHSRAWAWAVGLLLAVGVALAGGYFGTAAARRYFQPPKEQPTPAANAFTPTDDDPPPERLIEFLPLYAAADNLDFVKELATDPDLFADDVSAPVGIPAPPRTSWVADPAATVKAFKTLPPDRQSQIRLLDQQLHALDAVERAPLLRALESYTVWLDRLPEADRRGVLTAPTPNLRLDVVRRLRERESFDALPERIKTDPALREQWKKNEAERRTAWAFAREHWESIRGATVAWPFGNEEMKKQVIEYARVVYRLDEKDRSRLRLTLAEHTRLVEAYEEGEKRGVWLWFGKVVYDLSAKYEMLPEPDGQPTLTDFTHLWDTARTHYMNRPAIRKRLEVYAGRWPDFALQVQEDIARTKVVIPSTFRFGPARPEEFREPVREVLEKELFPRLSPRTRFALTAFEGRWPEYPRLLIALARQHDVSIPGTMLPGKPSEWDRTYGGPIVRPAMRPKG